MNELFTIGLGLFFLALPFLLIFLTIKYFKLRKTNKLLEEKYAPIISVEEAVNQLEAKKTLSQQEISELNEEYERRYQVFQKLQKQLSIYEEESELNEMGFYKPIFDYATSERYKEALTEIKAAQKRMIQEDRAISAKTDWVVNGSKREGEHFINQAKKMALRAFNNECNFIISKVSWRNFTNSQKRIYKTQKDINKFNQSNNIAITDVYTDLKIDELILAYELARKQKEEREELAEKRRLIREEERLEKERIQAEKEERRYQNLLEKARKEADQKAGEDLTELNAHIAKLEKQLAEAHQISERAKSMAEQTRAGFVYIISNIGAFGENIYKIGMTRRLEPLERIRELSGASVPFTFDLHGMIYSEDAPTLESQLHNHFSDRRVNLANYRKEFFNVTLDDIESELKNLGIEHELIKTPEAEEYRQTLLLRKQHDEKEKELKESFPPTLH